MNLVFFRTLYLPTTSLSSKIFTICSAVILPLPLVSALLNWSSSFLCLSASRRLRAKLNIIPVKWNKNVWYLLYFFKKWNHGAHHNSMICSGIILPYLVMSFHYFWKILKFFNKEWKLIWSFLRYITKVGKTVWCNLDM